MRAGFIYDRVLAGISLGPLHPFKPDRARGCLELCRRYGLMDPGVVRELEPAPASLETLSEFHTEEYLALLGEAARIAASEPPTMEMLTAGLGGGDNPIFPELWELVTRSTGATLDGLDALLGGELERAFNPVGGFHHGFPDHAEGFCYSNDVVLAALRARRAGRRVAVLDIDAHHGNGTQAAFWQDDRVLAISLHQDGQTIYPHSGAATEVGEGPGEGFTVNVPLSPGADDELFVQAFDRVVPRALDAFGPDLLIFEIGADMHRDDPLTQLRMTNRSFLWAASAISKRGGQILALGGGGYHPQRTVRAWTLAWAELSHQEPRDELAHAVGSGLYGVDAGTLLDPPDLHFDEDKETAREALEGTLEALEDGLARLEAACAGRG
ncbi:MAG: acetoin utilization protein AcuC [Polyangia bacterium]|jgi:acetoin utilization protein AcuC|nr:acetoin utilization protein AcuC [Polyangia bacterium]